MLFILANYASVNILRGNLSYSKFLDVIPMFDPYALLQMLIAGAAITSDLLVGSVVSVIIYGIITGRAFCSWACPINMITDLANFLRRHWKIDKADRSVRISRNIRYWAMWLGLILSFPLGFAAFELISPVSIVHRGIIYGLGFGWLVALAIFLFDLLILKNGFCGYLCPLGGFYSLLSRKSLIRVQYSKEKCSLCVSHHTMLCREVCPEPQVLGMIGKSSEQVLSGECSNCARCIEVCDDAALAFSFRSVKRSSGEDTTKRPFGY